MNTLYHVLFQTDALWLNTHISLMAVNAGAATQYRCGATVVSTATALSLEMTLQPASLRGE